MLAHRTLQKLQKSIRNPLPIQNKSNIKLNTSICLSFTNIAHKNSAAELRLIDNLIVSPNTSTVYGKICWLTWLENQVASGLMQRLIVCLLSMTEWLASNVTTWTLVHTY